MKIRKYLPIIIMFCLCVCSCVVGAYAISTTSIYIRGNINITAGSDSLNVDYGIQILNAAKSNAFSLNEPDPIYINSTNSANGKLIGLSSSNQNVELCNLFFSSHTEAIEDIQILVTLKNKSSYPIMVNFALSNLNTVGNYTDTTLKQVYLSENSQALGNSAVLNARGGIDTYCFFLSINDPTSDITGTFNFGLDVNFIQLEKAQIQTTIPTTPINMVDDLVINYMQNAENKSINEYTSSASGRMDVCKPFTFEYSYSTAATTSLFELSEDANLNNVKAYKLTTNRLTLQNLKTNTTYYYRLALLLSNGNAVYSTGSFETARTPRILNIDGAYNVRDIGGWQTSAIIKQGLLFRGTEIDGEYETKYTATAEGLKVLQELAIVTDFDLRGSSNKTPLEGATKIYFGSPMYSTALTSSNNAVMKNIFLELAKPTNYPMYLHCTYGCDRTGTICYLLEAVLGVSEIELIIEYELSSLHSGRIRTNADFVAFIQALNAYSGNTIQEKATNYLFSIGITQSQIDSIKNIFLEK